MKKLFSFRIDADLKSAVDQKAKREGANLTAVMTVLLKAYAENKVSLGIVPENGLDPVKTPIIIHS